MRPTGVVVVVVVSDVEYGVQFGVTVHLVQQPNYVLAQLVSQRRVLRLVDKRA